MNTDHSSTPASSAAKSTPTPTKPGAKPHSQQNWGAGKKPSGPHDHFIAGGAGNPKDHDVTPDDIARLIELSRERHGK